jgi:hypothetical protein
LSKLSKNIDPIIADKKDAVRTENLASDRRCSWPVNDSNAIKIDMVNPIPAKKPTPII